MIEPLLNFQAAWVRATLLHHAASAELYAVSDRGDLLTGEVWRMAEVIRDFDGAQQGCWS